MGDRWYRFAQPPATCCETFGFAPGIPCGPCFGGPWRHSPAWGCPGFLERVNGWGPWDPSVGHSIRVHGRSREPKNFLRGDSGTQRGVAMAAAKSIAFWARALARDKTRVREAGRPEAIRWSGRHLQPKAPARGPAPRRFAWLENLPPPPWMPPAAHPRTDRHPAAPGAAAARPAPPSSSRPSTRRARLPPWFVSPSATLGCGRCL